MPLSSRARILDYLQRNRSATALEISLCLGMTRANARHHLLILEDTGQVEVLGCRREGRGRPAILYVLSRHLRGDSLDRLSGLLLEQLLEGKSEVEKLDALRLLAGRLASPANGSLPERLITTVGSLSRQHYEARWEAGPDGARLILGNCPYAAILSAHPELCSLDGFLLYSSLGLAAQQIARLEKSSQGIPQCVFLLRTA